jgi:hypothetical protein
MKIVSYYTPLYQTVVKNLIKSLEKFNLPHYVKDLEEQGSWDKNTHYKPIFLLEQIVNEDAVVWTDADSVIKQEPKLFHELDCDVAFNRFNGELLSGTVYFKNTPATINLLKTWIKINEMNPQIWDQRNLDTAISQCELTIGELPPEYCCIYDLTRQKYPNISPVIEHFQASRTYNRKKN